MRASGRARDAHIRVKLHPADRVDHYAIEGLLGTGTWAEVYRAVDTRSGGTVVLKSPHPSLFADPAGFKRFRQEVAIVRSLDHPGVQRSLDGGHHRTEPYEVLEYVDGENLRHVIARAKGRLVPVAFAPHVTDAVPHAEHVELDCGHVPQLERPRETHEDQPPERRGEHAGKSA